MQPLVTAMLHALLCSQFQLASSDNGSGNGNGNSGWHLSVPAAAAAVAAAAAAALPAQVAPKAEVAMQATDESTGKRDAASNHDVQVRIIKIYSDLEPAELQRVLTLDPQAELQASKPPLVRYVKQLAARAEHIHLLRPLPQVAGAQVLQFGV